MKDLTKDELLDFLDDWYEYAQADRAMNVVFKPRDCQAYTQLKEIVGDWFGDLFEIRERGRQDILRQQKPRVTREEIKKKALQFSWASDEEPLLKWLNEIGVEVNNG